MRLGLVPALSAVVLASCAADIGPVRQPNEAGLTAFRSEADLLRFLEQTRRANQRARTADDTSVQEVVVTASRAQDNITNTQEVGVDEGGIVKARGDTLVILRRGRLITVSLANGGLRPVASIDAYPPGVNASGDWYDEMLIAGDWVVVIGFSYERGGTEINRFKLDAAGGLRFHDAYHLRSNDYYSDSNFASRLIDETLVLYTPLDVRWSGGGGEAMPAMRTWRGDAAETFRPIYRPRDIYVAPQAGGGATPVDALHTVIRCKLTAPTLDCASTGVFGPYPRSFYVSSEAVYLWTSTEGGDWGFGRGTSASVYRLPLNGGRPQAVRTRGAPLDQFSFREDRQRGVLDVLVQPDGGGDGMWSSDSDSGALTLLRLPLSRFGDGSGAARRGDYKPVPALPDGGWRRHNRFVGRNLLYSGEVYVETSDTESGVLNVVNLDDLSARSFNLPEPINRIEGLGDDALVVGGEETLAMTLVDLGRDVRLADRFVLPKAQEAESRSHGFFYRSDDVVGEQEGLLGLPILRPDVDGGERAEMAFVRRVNVTLSPAGDLRSMTASTQADDGCIASCVDWYGNARPIFVRGRVFALLGYELVEGREANGRIEEIGRIDFSPNRPVSRPDGR